MNEWKTNSANDDGFYPMNVSRQKLNSGQTAFTLIEMLVVITIIAILAAVIVPLAGNIAAGQKLKRVQGEMAELETAIKSYESARGHNPPDNPRDFAVPPLFYELTGTVYSETGATPKIFRRIHGAEQITEASAKAAFGVAGFVNSSYVQNPQSQDQIRESEVRDFLPDLKPAQYQQVNYAGQDVVVLGVPIDGPNDLSASDGRKINPWHYNLSNPTNNPSSYDLWMDVIIRGKTNRVCNWSEAPLIVN